MSDAAPAAPAAAPESAPVADLKDTPTAFGSEQAQAWAENSDDDFGGDYVARAIEAVSKKKAAEPAADATESAALDDKIGRQESPLDEVAANPEPVAAADAEKPKADEDKPRAAAWAELHKQKKALFAQEQAMKQKYAPLEARIAEFEAAKDDKAKALQLLGYEDPRAFLEEIAETGGKLTPERKMAMELKKELETLKADRQREQETKARAEQERAYKDSVDNHMRNIDNTLKTNPKFSKSLVALEGGREAVLEVMREHYAKTAGNGAEGEVMPYEKAAEIVDTRYKSQLDGLLGNEIARAYIASKLDSKSPSRPTVVAASQKPTAPAQKTHGESESADDINKRLEEATKWLKQKSSARSAR